MPKPVRKPSKPNATAGADSLRSSPFGLHRSANDTHLHGCPHLAALKTSSPSSSTAAQNPANVIAPAGQELLAQYRSCARYSLSFRNRSQLHVNRKNKQFKIMCQLDDEELPAVTGKKRKRGLGWMDKEIHSVEKTSVSTSRLHACLECVFLGCAKDRHLQEHMEQKGHHFAMDWVTCNVFCRLCDDYVYDNDFERMLQSEQERIDQIISRIKEPNSKKPRMAGWIPSTQEVEAIQTGSSLQRCSGLRGCFNLGNTCFMNAILQAMIHNPVLKFYFLSDQHSKSTCDKRDVNCMACHMDTVFQEFYNGETKPFGPAAFLHAMWMSQKQMAGYSQQDAHEFFISLANEMHNNCSNHEGPDSECSCIIHQTFAGLLQSDVTCSSCNAVSTAHDPILDMSLELKRRAIKGANGRKAKGATTADLPPHPADHGSADGSPSLKTENGLPPAVKNGKSKGRDPLDTCTLTECLDRYTVPEKLEYNCGQCKESKEATKQISVKKLPPILSIQLKRFEHSAKSSSSSKIETVVRVPAELDMTPYTTRAIKLRSRLRPVSSGQRRTSKGPGSLDHTPMDGIPSHMYSLFAVISHTGKLETGHYTTYARERDKWFAFDDHNVTLAKQKDVLEGNGYMCFYMRKGYQYPLTKKPAPQ
ncbi:hypothetical protein PhCBS80983_g04802 [Powellomyces hirtus]|uniref:ubiquitinyl hydrolase 1 n=1 Tax=Powellomyces hirtus TaxID=109895 RepID=A0A507DZ11_9FUNG|nr:hypothetical protein PhCBS80983_g04802 [Powellomyces hirtus]